MAVMENVSFSFQRAKLVVKTKVKSSVNKKQELLITGGTYLK